MNNKSTSSNPYDSYLWGSAGWSILIALGLILIAAGQESRFIFGMGEFSLGAAAMQAFARHVSDKRGLAITATPQPNPPSDSLS